MPVLQVKLAAEELDQLKRYARRRGVTQSQAVLDWVKSLSAGAPVVEPVEALPAGDGVIGVLMEQTELLRLLVDRLAPLPAGSAAPEKEEVRPVVLTEEAPMGGEEERERGERKALKLLEERERLERVQEMWLKNVAAGGDPCAPPGYEGMSEEEVREMGEKCLKVLRIDVVDEVLDQLLKKWKG
jgi:hypothetical protein